MSFFIEKSTATLNSTERVRKRCVGLTISWNQPYMNTPEHSALMVKEFDRPLPDPEMGARVYLNQAKVVRETKYLPDLSRAREYGWKEKNDDEFISSHELAVRSVIQFVELADRADQGEFR